MRPAWATQVRADLPFVERDGFLRFTIPRGDAPVAFGVTFGSRLVEHRDGRGEAYFTDGPCVLARALPAHATITRQYDVPGFADSLLWEARQWLSVANLTRQDGLDFLRQVPQMGTVTTTTCYPLQQANQALADLRAGRFDGAAVLVP